MSTTAKATGYLELDIKGFDQALKTAKNLMLGFAATFGAYKLGSFFKDGIKDAVDFGKEMQTASRTMGGFDAGKLLLVQKALEKTGMGAEEARGHVGDFIKEGRNISEIFGGADNYARALKSAAKDYGAQADVLTRSGKSLQTVWNTMESIGAKVRTFFLTMTEQFVGPLQVALDYLNAIDLAGVGADFGKAIGDAAATLFGLFKNGDMIETVRLGLTVAFQESVNWLVGGLNYAGAMLGLLVMKGFAAAVDFLQKGFKLAISAETIQDGFIAAGAKLISSILSGLNTVFRVLQAGIQYAIQSAIEAIPGASTFLGVGGDQRESFGEMYDQTKGNGIPQGFIDGISKAGQELTDRTGGKFKELMDSIGKPGEDGFKKGSVFDTSEDSAKLQELLANGFKTGTGMVEGAQKDNNNAAPKGVLTQFSGSSSKVIADSLAKVGGGGGYLRVGMTLQERTAMQTAMATKQTAEATQALLAETKANKPKPALMNR